MRAGDLQAQTVTREAVDATAAKRQRAYRLRQKRAAIDAIGYEDDASRVTLVSMLGQVLAALDARTTSAPMLRASRNSATRILNVIVTRYGIEL
jgi:hypothetical protein